MRDRRVPRCAAAPRRRPASALLPAGVAAALLVTGCHLIGSFSTGPEGQPPYDTDLRRLLREGRWRDALEATAAEHGGEAGDDLLLLHHAVAAAHYAGEWERSDSALEAALLEIDERQTKSISRAVLSLVTSDRALAWTPRRAERLMLHYYGALNRLSRGDVEGAAVEARRLGWLLDRTDRLDLHPEEESLRVALRYFAGAVFEVADEPGDAAVAYRHVWPPGPDPPEGAEGEGGRLRRPPSGLRPLGIAEFRPSAGNAAPDSTPPAVAVHSARLGEVVVFVERGFVAHRVERSTGLLLFPEEMWALDDDRDRIRWTAARCIARRAFDDLPGFGEAPGGWRRGDDGRCLVHGVSRPRRDERRSPRKRKDDGEDDDEPDAPLILRLAWPEFRRTDPPARPPVRVVADADTEVPTGLRADVSDAVIAEYRAGLGGTIVKTVARAATKAMAAHAVEEEVGDEGEVLGTIAGIAVGAAGALFERADTRTWHLLPSRIEVARLRLPPGRHRLEMRIGEQPGSGRRIALGTVTVRPGEVQVRSVREWP